MIHKALHRKFKMVQNRPYRKYTNPRHFPLSWLFTKLFTRVSRRVTILERLSSSPIFSGVSVVPSWIFCVELCGSLCVTWPLYFSHCIYCLCFFYERSNAREKSWKRKMPWIRVFSIRSVLYFVVYYHFFFGQRTTR
jgi:hypothetical protein